MGGGGEVCGAYGTHGQENLKRRYHVRGLVLDKRILLKWILNSL
jgi:hypothetical protein